MQKETVTLTLDLTLDELFHVTCFLRDLRNEQGSDPAYCAAARPTAAPSDGFVPPGEVFPQPVHYGQSVFPTRAAELAPMTVPVSALTAPNYQPPQTPVAAQQQPSMPPQWLQQPVAPIPTAAPTYTIDQLATAAAPLMDAGRGAELTAMLGLFGAASLNQIPPERYPDVAMNLRAMGAAI